MILIASFLVTFSVNAQYFTGEINSVTKIIPKNNAVLEDEIREKDGEKVKYIITNKYYKTSYWKDDVEISSYTYDYETKRMYDYTVGDQYITYRDSRKSNSEYYKSMIYRDSTIQLLGYDCFLMESESDSIKSKAYYSEAIRIDFELFEGHNVGNWYQKLKDTDGCLSLKSITEYDSYNRIQEAVVVNKREVKKSEFELPDLPIVASFSALDVQVNMAIPSVDQVTCYISKTKEAMQIEGRKDHYMAFVKFLLTKDGEMQYVRAYEEDDFGLHEIAVDIVMNCGLKFTPGKIEGVPVDSEVYFPVEFRMDL